MQKHPLDQLYDLKRELIERVRVLEAHQREIQATYPPRIKELSEEADRLAAIFKPLYQQSQDAYSADEKALAKELSDQAKPIHAECDGLNAQVNAMRKELADTKDAIITTRREIAELNSKITRYDRLSHIAIDGFEQAEGVSAAIVGEELSVLPPRLLQHIKRVTYVHEKRPNFELGRTASKEHNPDQTTIFLFQYPFDLDLAGLDLADLEEEYRNTIIHEAAHVLFDWVMSLDQRLKWGERHKDTINTGGQFINEDAGKGKRDDFVECFETYRHDPKTLREYDDGRYNDIESIYKEISSE